MMKKRFLIILVALLWCNVGYADILLKNCKQTRKAGDRMITGGVWEEDTVIELEEGERYEYFVSFENGHVYRTKVRSGDTVLALEEIQEGIEEITPAKASNVKYIINFAD